MVATSVLDSPSALAVAQLQQDAHRPDVGVIIGAEDADRAIDVAVRTAAATGGDVCVIRYVDNIGIRSTDSLIQRSEAARTQLARVVSEQVAEHADTSFTERLHVGTLESLLRTLEPSIGLVVSQRTPGPSIRQIVSLCPVFVCLVDAAGETIVRYPPAGGDDGG